MWRKVNQFNNFTLVRFYPNSSFSFENKSSAYNIEYFMCSKIKVSLNESCLTSLDCNETLGLACDGNRCVCSRLWNGSSCSM